LKINSILKSVELLLLSFFILSISTAVYSNTENNDISASSTQNDLSLENINVTLQQARLLQPPINEGVTKLVRTQRETKSLIDGLFLDGHAKSLEDQNKGPFLNPAEMGDASEQDVITKIKVSTYATGFELLFGDDILLNAEQAYNYVVDAIAAFERRAIFSESPEVNRNIAQGGRLGEFNITINEVDDLTAFLETLSDE